MAYKAIVMFVVEMAMDMCITVLENVVEAGDHN
jgi:hypothetical protein